MYDRYCCVDRAAMAATTLRTFPVLLLMNLSVISADHFCCLFPLPRQHRQSLSVSPSLRLLGYLKALLSVCLSVCRDARLQSPPSLFPHINLASLKAPAGTHVTHHRTWLDPVTIAERSVWRVAARLGARVWQVKASLMV